MMETIRHDGRRSPGSRKRQIAKIVSCGGMLGSSILFPLANADGSWFKSVTLSVFVLAAVVFHGLKIGPFMRYGIFAALAALLLVLVVFLFSGRSTKEIGPMLPLTIALFSIATIVYDRALGPARLGQSDSWVADELAGISIDTLSNDSSQSRTISVQDARYPPFIPRNLDFLYFGRNGPSSQRSIRTSASEFSLSLSSVVGQYRPDWDPQTQSHFAVDGASQVDEAVEGLPLSYDMAQRQYIYPDSDSGFETSSNHHLLGDLVGSSSPTEL